MRIITNPWLRLLASLFIGALLREIIFLLTGDPTRPRSKDTDYLMLVLVVVAFAILSFVAKRIKQTS